MTSICKKYAVSPSLFFYYGKMINYDGHTEINKKKLVLFDTTCLSKAREEKQDRQAMPFS